MDIVIYLEPDEEITSVIDKIKQAKSTRLNLVVPRGATLLQSVVNLKLLVKEATNLSKEIAIVTSDKIGRNLAAKVGLLVYDSLKSGRPEFVPPPPVTESSEIIEINEVSSQPVEQDTRPKGVEVHHFQEKTSSAPKAEWKPPAWQKSKANVKKEVDWSRLRKFIWPMLAIVVLLLLIGGFLIFPRVEVKLKVKAEDFQKTQSVQISSSEPSNNPDTATFAADIKDLSKEKEEKFPTTGKKNLGGKATGTITIYNNLDSNSHSLAAGTKFSSSSKTFILKSQVTVPSATVQNGKPVPGTVNADIEAENAGDDYNVKAGRFTIIGIPASQQESFYGQSSKDLTGGFTKEVQVVSQDDYDKAKDKISKELTDDLKKELSDQTSGLTVLEQGIQIDFVDESSSAKVDAEANEFNLKIKQRLRTMVFVRSNFDQFVIDLLEKQIPQDKMITLGGANDTISPEVKEKNYDQNLLKLQVLVFAKMSSRIDKVQVKEQLLGKSKKSAEEYLNGLSEITGFQMNFIPNWWPLKRIPNFQRNLIINLDYQEEKNDNSTLIKESPTPSSEISPIVSPSNLGETP